MSNAGSVAGAPYPRAQSSRNGWLYTLLLVLLGYTGAHRFYLGKIGLGIAYLFTFAFFGIGLLVDVIVLVSNSVRDADYATVEVDKGARVFIVLIVVAMALLFLVSFVIVGVATELLESMGKKILDEDIKSLRIELTTDNGEETRTIIIDNGKIIDDSNVTDDK